jgi:hypothetical protein
MKKPIYKVVSTKDVVADPEVARIEQLVADVIAKFCEKNATS